MNCPRCGEPLIERGEGLFEDIVVFGCAQCGGTFCPAGTLDRADDVVTVDIERVEWELAQGSSRLGCPQCRRETGYREHSTVALEHVRARTDHTIELARCGVCEGFWLERGQLDRVREHALHVSARENAALNAHGLRLHKEAQKRNDKK